ncbi:hypothetical protein V6N11_058556 [Hibiscus sabdariffa]|uniref:GH3 C-terminal domain-containing protein n=1 Tax=Hibiscus sabdariffa TaxID=183260 RepID=A0ABR2U571_9ROSI
MIQHFKNIPYDPFNVYTSPDETILGLDLIQGMYAQMLCDLIMREEVHRVGVVFASGLLKAIHFLQRLLQRKEQKRTGRVSSLGFGLKPAIEKASVLLKEANTNIVEYMSYVDTKHIPGQYATYWELFIKDTANALTEEVLSRCCLEMEESLNIVYCQCRVADSIGPLEIRLLKNGTFEELMDYTISRGAP